MAEDEARLELVGRGAGNLDGEGFTEQAAAIRELAADYVRITARLAQTPTAIIEWSTPLPASEQDFQDLKARFAEALQQPQTLVLLEDEWGVRYDWADKSIEPYADIPFPSRSEAEEQVALDPPFCTLIRRTLKKHTEQGPWLPVAPEQVGDQDDRKPAP